MIICVAVCMALELDETRSFEVMTTWQTKLLGQPELL